MVDVFFDVLFLLTTCTDQDDNTNSPHYQPVTVYDSMNHFTVSYSANCHVIRQQKLSSLPLTLCVRQHVGIGELPEFGRQRVQAYLHRVCRLLRAGQPCTPQDEKVHLQL